MKICRIALTVSLVLAGACSYNANKVTLPEGATAQKAKALAGRQWFCEGNQTGQWQCADLVSSSAIPRPTNNRATHTATQPLSPIPPTTAPPAVVAPAPAITAPAIPPVIADNDTPEEQPAPNPGLDSSSLLDYPSNYVAVQLIAARNTDTLEYYQQQRPKLKTQQLSIMRDQQQWHILLLGVYPSITEAQRAIDAVETSLGEAPWIRSITSLKNHLIH